MVGGVNLDCVLTSAGESGMVERFPVRSEGKTQEIREKIIMTYPTQYADILTQEMLLSRATHSTSVCLERTVSSPAHKQRQDLI